MTLKDQILEKVTPLSIYRKYISNDLVPGRAVKSPLRDKDRHPSFNVYVNSRGKMLFKDFAGEEGDVFYFVMLLFNVDFKTAVEIIADDFNIQKKSFTNLRSIKRSAVSLLPQLTIKKRAKFTYRESIMSDTDFRYWREYGITRNVLTEYNVKKAMSMTLFNEDGTERFTLESQETEPIYVYDYGNDTYRFYRPLSEILKHVGNANGQDVFGLVQSEDSFKASTQQCSVIAICAGQKDCLSLYANTNIRGVSLNSESCKMSLEILFRLKDMTNNIVVIYDNDKTGKEHAKKLCSEYNLRNIDITSFTNYKDISDYYQKRKTGEEDHLFNSIMKT